MEVIFKSKKVEAIYHSEDNYFYYNWLGFQNKKSIIETATKLLETFEQQTSCFKVLNDNSQVTGPWQDSADWATTEWFPAMEKAGLKKFAWIFPSNIFAELSAKKVSSSLESSSKYLKTFYSLNEAKVWLLGKEQVKV